MLKVLENEYMKYFRISKFVVHIVMLAAAALLYAILVNKYKGSAELFHESVYLSYLIGALNGILIKPLIPILLIITSASVIARDYSDGCMKFFLISKLKKEELIASKLIFRRKLKICW